jgi:hypothetical protein
MPFTHDDYEKIFGHEPPTFYTTPTELEKCKNLNLEGATPCWHPHCDCQPIPEKKSMAFDFIAFLKAVAVGLGAVVALFLIAVTLGALKLYGVI